jgi:hypothetical protein
VELFRQDKALSPHPSPDKMRKFGKGINIPKWGCARGGRRLSPFTHGRNAIKGLEKVEGNWGVWEVYGEEVV